MKALEHYHISMMKNWIVYIAELKEAYMKWILIIILIFIIMLIAHAVSEQYKEKFNFYENLKTFLNQFKINIAFKQEKIIDFLEKTKSKKQFNLLKSGVV